MSDIKREGAREIENRNRERYDTKTVSRRLGRRDVKVQTGWGVCVCALAGYHGGVVAGVVCERGPVLGRLHGEELRGLRTIPPMAPQISDIC